jgi:hypothetical protein
MKYVNKNVIKTREVNIIYFAFRWCTDKHSNMKNGAMFEHELSFLRNQVNRYYIPVKLGCSNSGIKRMHREIACQFEYFKASFDSYHFTENNIGIRFL